MVEILEHATIVYSDGTEERFDALRITNKGVIIGRIFSLHDGCEEFVDCGFIAQNSIKNISNATPRIIRRTEV